MSLWSPAPLSAPQKVTTTLKEKIRAEAQERATFHVNMLKTKWTDVLWEWRQITKGKNYLGVEEGGQNILQFTDQNTLEKWEALEQGRKKHEVLPSTGAVCWKHPFVLKYLKYLKFCISLSDIWAVVHLSCLFYYSCASCLAICWEEFGCWTISLRHNKYQ